MISKTTAILINNIQDVCDYLDVIGVDYSHIIKRRDPKEPGRRRKEVAEVKLYRWARGYWRAQAKHIRNRLVSYYPWRKALDVDTDFIMSNFDGDPWMAKLKLLLTKAAQDGVLLFEEMVTIGIDPTLTNIEAAKWASEHSFDLVTGLDKTTMEGLQHAVSTFVETPGMTIGDTMRLMPFTEQRAHMVSVAKVSIALDREAAEEAVPED